MVRQKKAPAARRRPMSREEALARQERQQRRRELEQESRELAKGPIDLPFFILVMLLTGVGLVMLLSGQDFATLQTPLGKEMLLQQALASVQELAQKSALVTAEEARRLLIEFFTEHNLKAFGSGHPQVRRGLCL
mgnify:CR=1 FL=1